MKRLRKEHNNPQIRDEADATDSASLPQDLIIEILAKLPPKSLAKLMVVSKLWSRIIRSKDFTHLFLTRSLTRPCFLFTFSRNNIQFFHSASQDSPSSDHHHTTSILHPDPCYVVSPPIRGLICCQNFLSKVMIANPSTGQIFGLPKVKTRRRHISSFFGYDSVNDEYKVLSMTVVQLAHKYGPVVSEEHQVFTLEAHKKATKWRMIQCKYPHCPVTRGLCMNGVVYYGSWSNSHRAGSLIVGFDVRLEAFTLVKLPDGVKIKRHHSELVNYQRKIALVNQSYKGEVEFWVLEDVDKQEWSKISVVVPFWEDLIGKNLFKCRGVISTGEFIFAPFTQRDPFYIISYNPKEDIARRVEIEGIGDGFDSITVFLNHVEVSMIL